METSPKDPSVMPQIPPRHRHIIEMIIALTLQIGVITAVVLVLLGSVLTFMHHPDYVHDPRTLPRLIGNRGGGSSGSSSISSSGGNSGESAPATTITTTTTATTASPGPSDFPSNLHDMGVGLANFKGQAIIVLGLLVLIATPVVRVAISVLIFLVERDYIFVWITLIVLALLLLSFFLGKAEA